jgi:murein DD-endopeptidase MepM/ murein hydrolase activator NlpD
MKQLNKKGFAHLGILLFIIVIAAVSAVGYMVYSKQGSETEQMTGSNAQASAKKSEVKIKNLGINLDYYNPDTGMAGDLKFTKANFASGMQMLFSEYGYQVAASSAGPAKKNPQPTFIAPLGTKVMSLVDGEVVNVPKLYSKDYSVHVQAEGSDLIFETEHVINVKVKQGDKVKAGDVIAEVSDYDAKNYDGLGLMEIGILKGGNPPSHICPFDYLDDSIKESTLNKITALKKSWEEYRGDTTIYDEAKAVIPGCLTREPIEG